MFDVGQNLMSWELSAEELFCDPFYGSPMTSKLPGEERSGEDPNLMTSYDMKGQGV